jgi:1-acyl-sn-glycerol-3-phosphate acyltransferase
VSDEHDLSIYSSPGGKFARFIAQRLLMRPYFSSVLHVQLHGKENLKKLKSPFITIANHSSHLDACMVFTYLPWRLSKTLAAGAAADYFFTKWYKKLGTRLFFNSYPVERAKDKRKKGLSGELLEHGIPILIFPEGTRSRTGAMGAFNPGAPALSISRDVPILPIAMVGNYAAMPYGSSRPVPGRPDVHVVFGLPMKASAGEDAEQFAERLRRYIIELHDTTARAYSMPTQADFDRAVALRTAAVPEGELPPY